MANNPAASGSSSKGSNTPLGRPKTNSLKKHNHLKRAASPHMSASETSGNESTRKKHKKKHHGSSQPSGAGTPRQNSLAPSSSAPAGDRARKSSIVTLPMNGFKLSAISSRSPNPHNSDTEMSDAGGVPKKSGIKLRLGAGSASPSGQNTPNGSRAGSPVQRELSSAISHALTGKKLTFQQNSHTPLPTSAPPFQPPAFQSPSC